MFLENKTLEKLRDLINRETEYRSGPQLVKFFNELGASDDYFSPRGEFTQYPSPGDFFDFDVTYIIDEERLMYTEEQLEKINGTPMLKKCIKNVFAPINFIDRYQELDELIFDFNRYLAFNKWKVSRVNADITLSRLKKIEIDESVSDTDESDFLSQEFSNLNLDRIGLESTITETLLYRVEEIERCFASKSPLAVILLAGSTLEGLLLGVASQKPKAFNTANCSPKNTEGKVKQFDEWTLNNLIEVAKEIGLIHQDVHKFSHALRDFRNYIHPFQQVSSGFNPTIHTAKICLQVLKVAIHQVNENIGKVGT